MGLLTVVRKVKQKEHEMRVLLLGLDNAGKTTLLKRLVGELGSDSRTDLSNITASAMQASMNIQGTLPTENITTESTAPDAAFAASETDPTLGFNIRTLQHGGFKINVWDIGGQRSIRSYWRNYFEDTDAVLWVIDSADLDDTRLADSRDELARVLAEDRIAGAPVILICNKQDIPGAIPPNDILDRMEIVSLIGSSRHWKSIGCSAISREGSMLLVDAVDWIICDVSQRIYLSS